MSLLDSVLGVTTPVNREELLAICEKKIAAGAHQEAASLAQKYKNRVISSTDLSENQKAVDMGYAYYLIGKAVFESISSSPTFRTYDYFKAFFAAHRVGYWYFQQVLMRDCNEWDENSEHYPYFMQLDSFYDELYQTFSENPELERADSDANDEISLAQRGL